MVPDEQSGKMPIPAIAAIATPTNRKKRKKSYIERSMEKKSQRALFVNSNLNGDKTVIERNIEKKKHCGLCGDTGHHQYNCMRLKADFGGEPLSNKNRIVRDRLAKNIVCSVSLPGFPIFSRKIDDDRIVLNEFLPKLRR